MGLANRRHVAISSGRASFARDLLATIAAMVRGGRPWLRAWRTLLGILDERGLLMWDETFLDGSFAPAEKGGSAVGKTKRGKGTK